MPEGGMKDTLDRLRAAPTIREAVEALGAIGAAIGMPIAAVVEDLSRSSIIHDEEGRPISDPFGWPAGFIDRWLSANYTLHNPISQRCRLEVLPFGWTPQGIMADREGLSPRQQRVLRDLAEIGIAAGISAPVHLPRARIASVSWLSRTPCTLEPILAASAGELLTAGYLFMAHILWRESELPLPRDLAALSPREIECLTWAAWGKSDTEIAQICALSPATVRSYIEGAAEKLDARTRTQAVAIASQLGMIGRAR